MKTHQVTPDQIARRWYLVDAEGQTLGRLASRVAQILRGKHKPIYTPHMDTGDHVLVVNAEKVRLTGKKLDQKRYYRHSGYPGGQGNADPAAGDAPGAGGRARGPGNDAQGQAGQGDDAEASRLRGQRASAPRAAAGVDRPGGLAAPDSAGFGDRGVEVDPGEETERRKDPDGQAVQRCRTTEDLGRQGIPPTGQGRPGDQRPSHGRVLPAPAPRAAVPGRSRSRAPRISTT